MALTRLPASRKALQDVSTVQTIDYSAREVAPAQLLVAQLVGANSLFLLHHAASLTELLSRVGRTNLCGLLERYWTKFARDWEVLLHGNPAATIYNAIKLSGGGELGIGVGEEAWGSGEREVLEGFIDRTEGLQDLVVGRYGLPPATDRPNTAAKDIWLGTGNEPAAADGIIFTGTGLVSRESLRTVSRWIEAIFRHGDGAYGVGENPSSRPRPRRRRQKGESSRPSDDSSAAHEVRPRLRSPRPGAPNLRKQAIENSAAPPGIPAPLVGQVEASLDKALAQASNPKSENDGREPASSDETSATENMMKYLKLGYGTAWTLNPKGLNANKDTNRESETTHSESDTMQQVDPTPEVSEDEQPFKQKLEQSIGRFLIGLSGDLEQMELDSDDGQLPRQPDNEREESRLFVRTLTVKMAAPRHRARMSASRTKSKESVQTTKSRSSNRSQPEPKTSAAASVDGAQPNISHDKVQVAVYVHQPFIFVFLFELHTPNLTMPSFYRNIHNQLGPLQRPLLRSTDPSRIAERIAEHIGEKSATAQKTSSVTQNDNPIYDLVYDPQKMTIRTSIPNIPVPGSLAAEGLTSSSSKFLSVSGSWYTLGIPIGPSEEKTAEQLIKSAWSRTEALNAHTQILNTYLATRSGHERENTVKTARGWWVLWMHIQERQKDKQPASDDDATPNEISRTDRVGEEAYREAFLVRRAFEPRPGAQSRTVSTGRGKWLLREQKRDVTGASTIGGASSARGVSDGVGVDARKWIEGLLSLTQ